MCGIAGFWKQSGVTSDPMVMVRRMTHAIAHRGPDDEGHWVDPAAGIALGHRRLSILDLSPEGHQPMFSPSRRYSIVFNGEVYNFQQIRDEAGAHSWRGHSDTEVMLAAFERWGLEKSVLKFVGMFAFALWDHQERTLHLVRDRLGIKPLYYGWCGGTLLFGSELKALRAHPDFVDEIDRGAVALLMRHNYIPAPHSIYRSIRKLPPGTILSLRDSTASGATPVPYWSAREAAERGIRNPFPGSEREAEDQLDSRLREAIKLRMVADVPLGAFLSGGIDSSVVVALMQAQNSRPIKTFSIGFGEESHNEAKYAAAVARHLKTDHTELYVSSQDALDVIPKLPRLFDEPFSDSSQIPTYLVSELARRHVTVSLSGDGGDELFAGYTRYDMAEQLWRKLNLAPRFVRTATASFADMLGSAWQALHLTDAGKYSPNRLLRMRDVLRLEDRKDLYLRLMSFWDGTSVVLQGSEPPTVFTAPEDWSGFQNFTEQMMYMDLVSYLPDDILVKVDRASMSVSLEARVPLIDHRIVEFAWRLPPHWKARNGIAKHILKRVLYRYVPPALLDRPKMGFAIPLSDWLRGPLRDWSEALLDENRLRQDGFFHPGMVRAKWRQHLAGEGDWSSLLWNVLMFQSWLESAGQLRPATIAAAN